MIFMLQTHCLQQIQGGQQIEFTEKEMRPDNHAGQPRAPFSRTVQTQNPHLLASLNLLEIQLMNPNRRRCLSTTVDSTPSAGLPESARNPNYEPQPPPLPLHHRRFNPICWPP
jgi:hypothetical protein